MTRRPALAQVKAFLQREWDEAPAQAKSWPSLERNAYVTGKRDVIHLIGPLIQKLEEALADPALGSSLITVVNEQAEDAGLWFVAKTAPEAYLQQALRRLHAAIEQVPALGSQEEKTTLAELETWG